LYETEDAGGKPTFEQLRPFNRVSWTGQDIRVSTRKEMENALLYWGFPKQMAEGMSVDIQMAKDLNRSASPSEYEAFFMPRELM
jgi:hypothetical protein